MSKAKASLTSRISLGFAFGLLKLFAKLPYPVVVASGRLLGRLLYRIKSRRLIVEANLRYCFPNQSFDQRQALAKRHFLSLGEGFAELALAWYKPFHKLKKYHRIKGLEHYQKAKDSNQGILFLGYHTTSLELAGAVMANYLDFAAFYRPNKNPVLDKHIQQGRNNRSKTMGRNDIRSIGKWLKSGEGLWLMPDQDMGRHSTVFAPFFGNPACTLNSPPRITKLGKAKVLPVCYYKDDKGIMTIEVLPEIEFTGDDQIDCTMINKILEACIMQAPEQYYWVHRRFKTLPQGQRSIYFQKPPKLKSIDSKLHDGALYSGDILSQSAGMPKLVRTIDGQLLNVFHRQTSLGVDITRKELESMLKNCAQLTFRGFYTITPQEFTYCAERHAYMLRYQETPGVALHHIPHSRRQPTAIILGSWLAHLHNEGVRLCAIRETNIELLPNGSPILLNPRQCKFYDSGLKESLRKKDIAMFIDSIGFLNADDTSRKLFHEQYRLNRLNQLRSEDQDAAPSESQSP
ncbi:lysophospholipid acyltransferase family protein [Kangiella shandongensis]|uniref:lysophospholipid acyltransferase family protein n=1 Tax=Kangiella shandongensis TaxID=2763258 RepID=UPI001CBF24E7|nr:lysophospholipid acyltransferase family protein [Kangiella shandongensis]